MAKNSVSDWDTTAANNTDVGGVNIGEGCSPSNINNAIREIMAQIKADSSEVSAKTANYTVTAGDNGDVIAVSAAAANRTVTLPPAGTAGNGFKLVIKKTDSSANTVTIDGDGSETIDGSTTKVLRLQNQSAALICDGTGWHVMGEGTVFESGSNANGDYTRFADGTQICTSPPITVTKGSGYSQTAWVFPSAFVGPPTPILTPDFATANGGGGRTAYNMGVVTSPSGNSLQVAINLMDGAAAQSGDWSGHRAGAVGRWY